MGLRLRTFVTILAFAGGMQEVAASSVLALSQSEAWLLRAAVVLFVLMLVFCGVVWRQVRESTRIANEANALATDLDSRTAALEETYGPKE